MLRGDLPRLHRCTSIITASSSSPISRSKPLKYAYEKEIVLYAHHRKLDYFSTECIYSPEAFRGSARALIKSLERVRPSAILDIVRSGEAMVNMVPPEIRGVGCGGSGGSGQSCATEAAPAAAAAEDEEGETGCGKGTDNAKSTGGEMATFEQQLQENEKAASEGLEIEITAASARRPQSLPLKKKKQPQQRGKQRKPQELQNCRRCGYMSSQELCKACVILDDLNKNRPRIEVELDDEEEEASSSVRRKMEMLELTKRTVAETAR